MFGTVFVSSFVLVLVSSLSVDGSLKSSSHRQLHLIPHLYWKF
jgi:hypothetical protein